jgi:hypothetical protein
MEFVQLDKKFFIDAYMEDPDIDYTDESDYLFDLLNNLFNWVSNSEVSFEVTREFLDVSISWLTSYRMSKADYVSSIIMKAISNGNYRIHSVKDKELLRVTRQKISKSMYEFGNPQRLQDLYSSLGRVVDYLKTHDDLLASTTGLAILTPDKEVNKKVIPFARLIWVSDISNEIAHISLGYKGKDKKGAFQKLDSALNELMNTPSVSKGSVYSKKSNTVEFLQERLPDFEFDSDVASISQYVRSLVKVIQDSKDGRFKVKITDRTSIPTFVGLPKDGVVYFDAVTSALIYTPELTAQQRVDVLELLLQCQFIVVQDLPTLSQAKFLFGEELSDSDLKADINADNSKPKLRDSVFVF